MNHDFNKDELERYSRHLILPEFNIEGQRKLKNSSVLIVGAGGLGCPMLLYLAAAGVGKIGIVDFDIVDKSNLQRQILYTIDDIGKPKAERAAKRLSMLNPHIEYNVFNTKLNAENALNIINKYDLVADGTDNFPTRYLVNDACVILNKPNVHGSIFRFEGQVSVFNHRLKDGTFGPQYRDIFPAPPPPGLVPNCAEGGVLGVLPGIIGSLQASEIIKVLTGIGETLAGKLFIIDTLTFESRTLIIKKNPELIPVTELIDYDDFCGVSETVTRRKNKVSVLELKKMLDNNDSDFVLIDVREPYEYEIANIGGELIPLGEIDQYLDKIPVTGKIIFHCRTDVRSIQAIEKLQNFGFQNLYFLEGGIVAWAKEIDNSLPVY